jgi:diketogulonate reductase-like aldo/keto reductase
MSWGKAVVSLNPTAWWIFAAKSTPKLRHFGVSDFYQVSTERVLDLESEQTTAPDAYQYNFFLSRSFVLVSFLFIDSS